ncbi:uncharacterized protein EI97DRAFT_313997 [Westerdykella ornata]|uniref:Uncharacterized protein n=1 Tax=Westerdykella ornata TaxID=318751 RepID=A0A6A6JL31_WESOR|nr:uncharacterized protein EI97DRAFT_313997 [Westerdykella ornata]KAF2277227.1 hypothetical protein EI97DRAFT_313997 [Westerdykella ornata]
MGLYRERGAHRRKCTPTNQGRPYCSTVLFFDLPWVSSLLFFPLDGLMKLHIVNILLPTSLRCFPVLCTSISI